MSKKLFETFTKFQKFCFIFLVCCIKAKKTPIIQGPTASGKSYLVSNFAKLLGQKTNLYQMNSNTGLSILTGQKIIKEFDNNEKETIRKAFKSIKNIIKYKKKSTELKYKDYKKIIFKIDEKLEEKDIDEEAIDLLKKKGKKYQILLQYQVDLFILILPLKT